VSSWAALAHITEGGSDWIARPESLDEVGEGPGSFGVRVGAEEDVMGAEDFDHLRDVVFGARTDPQVLGEHRARASQKRAVDRLVVHRRSPPSQAARDTYE
jgi:hypothetical protein